MSDRILSVVDLLLGAAYADKELKEQERAEVRALVKELAGEVSADVEARIKTFDPAQFDLKAAAAPFFVDGDDEKRKLLFLVARSTKATRSSISPRTSTYAGSRRSSICRTPHSMA